MTYAGDVTPSEAYAAVTGPEDALLVDVRTRAEWTYVEVRAAGLEAGRPVYLLCRSGVRSKAAAAALTAAGLGPAFNVLEGFEGPHDDEGHRTVSGWKVAGLPWRQG